VEQIWSVLLREETTSVWGIKLNDEMHTLV